MVSLRLKDVPSIKPSLIYPSLLWRLILEIPAAGRLRQENELGPHREFQDSLSCRVRLSQKTGQRELREHLSQSGKCLLQEHAGLMLVPRVHIKNKQTKKKPGVVEQLLSVLLGRQIEQIQENPFVLTGESLAELVKALHAHVHPHTCKYKHDPTPHTNKVDDA